MTSSLNEEGISAYFVLFSALLALVLILSKYLHDRPRLASLLPEAGMILIVGVVFGAVIDVLFISDSSSSTSSSSQTQQQQQQQQQGQYDNNYNDDDAVNEAVDEEVAKSLLSFSDEVFFLFLLPPIIFNSGYHLRKELFFRHITPIILFAVVGVSCSDDAMIGIVRVYVLVCVSESLIRKERIFVGRITTYSIHTTSSSIRLWNLSFLSL